MKAIYLVLFLTGQLLTGCGSDDTQKNGRPKLSIVSHHVDNTWEYDNEVSLSFSAQLSDSGIQNYSVRWAINFSDHMPANCDTADHVESVFAGIVQKTRPLGSEVSYRVCAHDTKTDWKSDGKSGHHVAGDD